VLWALIESDVIIASEEVKSVTNIKSELSRHYAEAKSQNRRQRLIFITISNVSRDVLPEILWAPIFDKFGHMPSWVLEKNARAVWNKCLWRWTCLSGCNTRWNCIRLKNYSVCYSRFSGMFPHLTMKEYSIWYTQNKLWYSVKTFATFSKILSINTCCKNEICSFVFFQMKRGRQHSYKFDDNIS